jgi:hypothetical protein
MVRSRTWTGPRRKRGQETRAGERLRRRVDDGVAKYVAGRE